MIIFTFTSFSKERYDKFLKLSKSKKYKNIVKKNENEYLLTSLSNMIIEGLSSWVNYGSEKIVVIPCKNIFEIEWLYYLHLLSDDGNLSDSSNVFMKLNEVLNLQDLGVTNEMFSTFLGLVKNNHIMAGGLNSDGSVCEINFDSEKEDDLFNLWWGGSNMIATLCSIIATQKSNN